MKYLISCLLCMALLLNFGCQPDAIDPNIYNSEDVDQMPEFPGGTQKLYEYISSQIKYPAEARENGISGKVVVKFYVDTEGFVRDVHAQSGPGHGLNEEAVRVVKLMNVGHRWTPGMKDNKEVSVYFLLPIKFVL